MDFYEGSSVLRALCIVFLFLLPHQSRASWEDVPPEVKGRQVAEYLAYNDNVQYFAVNRVMRHLFPVVQAHLVGFAPVSYFTSQPSVDFQRLLVDRTKNFSLRRSLAVHSRLKSLFLSSFFSDFEQKNLKSDLSLWVIHGNRILFMMYLEAALFRRFDDRYERALERRVSMTSEKSLQDIRTAVYPKILQAIAAMIEETDAPLLAEFEAVSQQILFESQSWPLSKEFYRDVDLLEKQVDLYRLSMKTLENFGDLDLLALVGQKDFSYSFSKQKRFFLRFCEMLDLQSWADQQSLLCGLLGGIQFMNVVYSYLSFPNDIFVLPALGISSFVIAAALFIPILPAVAHDSDAFATTPLKTYKKIYESMYSATSPSDVYINFETERIVTFRWFRPRPRISLMFADDILASKETWENFKKTFFSDLSDEEAEYMKPWFSQIDRVQTKVESLAPADT